MAHSRLASSTVTSLFSMMNLSHRSLECSSCFHHTAGKQAPRVSDYTPALLFFCLQSLAWLGGWGNSRSAACQSAHVHDDCAATISCFFQSCSPIRAYWFPSVPERFCKPYHLPADVSRLWWRILANGLLPGLRQGKAL